MEKVYLPWNFPNWFTVLLMVGLGGSLIGLIVSGMQSFMGVENDA